VDHSNGPNIDSVIESPGQSEEFQTQRGDSHLPKALVVIALEPVSAKRVHELVEVFVAYSHDASSQPAEPLRVAVRFHHPLKEGTRAPDELRAEMDTDPTQIIVTHSDILSWIELLAKEPDRFTVIYIRPNVLTFGDLAHTAVNFPAIGSRFYWKLAEYIDSALARRQVISVEEAFYHPQRIAETLTRHGVLRAGFPGLSGVGAERIDSDYRRCMAALLRPLDGECSPLPVLMPGFLPGKRYGVNGAPGVLALEDGWSISGHEYTWSNDDHSVLILYIDSGAIPLRLKLYGKAVDGRWAARILVNGALATYVKLPAEADRWLTIEVDLTSSPGCPRSCFRVDLEFDNVVRPSDSGGGNKDSRRLSFALRWFEITVADDVDSGSNRTVEIGQSLDECIVPVIGDQSHAVASLSKQLLAAGFEGSLVRTFRAAEYHRSFWLNPTIWIHRAQSALQLAIKPGEWVADKLVSGCSQENPGAGSGLLTELRAATVFGNVGRLIHDLLSSPDEARLIELWSPAAFLQFSNSLGLPGNTVSRLPDIAVYGDGQIGLYTSPECRDFHLTDDATIRIQGSSFYVMQTQAADSIGRSHSGRTDICDPCGVMVAVQMDGYLDFVIKGISARRPRTKPTVSIIRSLLENSQPGMNGGAPNRRKALMIQYADFAYTNVGSVAYCRYRGTMPAVSLIPDPYFFEAEGYRGIREAALRDALPSWESRSELIFWRGGATTNYRTATGQPVDRVESVPRVAMCETMKNCQWADVAIMHAWALPLRFEGVKERLLEMGVYRPVKRMIEHANYRYLIDVDGVANSWSFFEKMLLGSCILKVSSPFEQWFYDRIHPWKHFVPVEADFSDLKEKCEWCLQNPDEARNIGAEAQRFALEHTYEIAWQGAVAVIQSLMADHDEATLHEPGSIIHD
jgi:hypothetical protein